MLTDYKPQSRTTSRTLPGRGDGEKVDKRETTSQMSRLHQLLRAKNLLILGNKHVKRVANKTTEAFTTRHIG